MDYKNTFESLIEDYKRSGAPICVDFRTLVSSIKFTDRATHSIHTYTAKLIPHIPFFFFNNSYFVKSKDKILDPFSGSGTVLLEAKLAGLNPFGSDANPLARLISCVKCNKYDLSRIVNFKDDIKRRIHETESETIHIDSFATIDFWFNKEIQHKLQIIKNCILRIENIKYRNFFLVCFSNMIRKVSLADSRISVPVKINPERYSDQKLKKSYEKKIQDLQKLDVVKKFFEIVDANIKRFEDSANLSNKRYTGKIISTDSRSLSKLQTSSIDLILTSPPYAGAQKYIRASSLNLYWLGFNNISQLDKLNIGRENYKKSEYSRQIKTDIKEADQLLNQIYEVNPLRSYIAGNYLLEMRDALKESIRVLKKDKYLILIAANNVVCRKEFKTQEYLKDIVVGLGCELICELIDDIKSYGLMTKRNKTASIITCEHIMIFKKNG